MTESNEESSDEGSLHSPECQKAKQKQKEE